MWDVTGRLQAVQLSCVCHLDWGFFAPSQGPSTYDVSDGLNQTVLKTGLMEFSSPFRKIYSTGLTNNKNFSKPFAAI